MSLYLRASNLWFSKVDCKYFWLWWGHILSFANIVPVGLVSTAFSIFLGRSVTGVFEKLVNSIRNSRISWTPFIPRAGSMPSFSLSFCMCSMVSRPLQDVTTYHRKFPSCWGYFLVCDSNHRIFKRSKPRRLVRQYTGCFKQISVFAQNWYWIRIYRHDTSLYVNDSLSAVVYV